MYKVEVKALQNVSKSTDIQLYKIYKKTKQSKRKQKTKQQQKKI